jgi:hypothetical protein
VATAAFGELSIAPACPPIARGWARLRRRLFGIDPDEVSLSRRGIKPASDHAGERLERIGRTFVNGYHAALESADLASLTAVLDRVDIELRGFAYEGAAMGRYLLDRFCLPGGRRFNHFLAGPAAPHVYMTHVGAGWAMARLPWRVIPALRHMDSLMRWLAIDGYAFHEAFFRAERVVERQEIPRSFSGYARRAFDLGLGRGLWFVEGADVRRIAARIRRFELHRHADLWSGTGLACAYAGGVDEADVAWLRETAQTHRPALAQGAVFAAKARQRAGNPAAHTDLAVRLLCDCSADRAAAISDEAQENLPPDGDVPAFEIWRKRIQNRFIRKANAS